MNELLWTPSAERIAAANITRLRFQRSTSAPSPTSAIGPEMPTRLSRAEKTLPSITAPAMAAITARPNSASASIKTTARGKPA